MVYSTRVPSFMLRLVIYCLVLTCALELCRGGKGGGGDRPTTLSMLLQGSDVTAAAFVERHYDSASLHVTGTQCAELLELPSAAMDALVDGFSTYEPYGAGLQNFRDIKLARAAPRRDSSSSSSSSSSSRSNEDGNGSGERGHTVTYHLNITGARVTPQMARYAFQRRGFTLIINQADARWPSIFNTVATLNEELNGFGSANIYYTPRGAQGFEAHFDYMDVFVCQIEGHKAWTLFNSPVQRPRPEQKFRPPPESLSVQQRLTMKPGDLLYLPRGVAHQAQAAQDSDSLHVTIGVQPFPLWQHVLQRVVEHVIREEGTVALALQGRDASGQIPPLSCLTLAGDKDTVTAYVRYCALAIYAETLANPTLRSSVLVGGGLGGSGRHDPAAVIPESLPALGNIAAVIALLQTAHRDLGSSSSSSGSGGGDDVGGKRSYETQERATVDPQLSDWPEDPAQDYSAAAQCLAEGGPLLQERIHVLVNALARVLTPSAIKREVSQALGQLLAFGQDKRLSRARWARRLVKRHMDKWQAQEARAAVEEEEEEEEDGGGHDEL